MLFGNTEVQNNFNGPSGFPRERHEESNSRIKTLIKSLSTMDTTLVVFYPEQARKLCADLWNHLYAAVQGGEHSDLSKNGCLGGNTELVPGIQLPLKRGSGPGSV